MKLAGKMRAIAEALGLDFALDEDPQVFWLRAPGETDEDGEVFTVRAVSGHWLYVAPGHRPFARAVEPRAQDAALLHALLRENDRTKSGRFFIDGQGFVNFAVDLRLADLSEDLMDDSLNLIHHVMNERVPALAAALGMPLHEDSDPGE